MPLERRELGAKGEKIALEFLKKRKYKILERNFRCRKGEIDIIARQGECLVFVEVRAKSSTEMGIPEESITPIKEQRLADLADTYLQSLKELPADWRIDVVAIELDSRGKATRIELIENAV